MITSPFNLSNPPQIFIFMFSNPYLNITVRWYFMLVCVCTYVRVYIEDKSSLQEFMDAAANLHMTVINLLI